MWKKSLLILTVVTVAFACSKTAFTGRKSLTLIPSNEINSLSNDEYRKFLAANQTLTTGKEVEMVRRIGNDLKEAVIVYYRKTGKAAELKNFNWEFNVVESKDVNAWCMPGGKVVVYTGILPVTQNEDALAVVMGHEIAHALADHGNERMSQGMVAQLGMSSLDIALSQKSSQTRQLLMTAAGIGAQYGVLMPFSRKHESEADEIGLYLMTMAGYNPAEAAPFWQRMSRAGGASPPEFMSTHPDPSKRSTSLKKLIPKAQEYKRKYPVPNSSRNRK